MSGSAKSQLTIVLIIALIINTQCNSPTDTNLFPNQNQHLNNGQKSDNYASKIGTIDSLLEAAVSDEIIPGAVVLISHNGRTIHNKAFGYAQLYSYGKVPLNHPIRMTTRHRFDLASLTKVFATTFGIMLLVDKQMVNLDAPVYTYLPFFRGGGKDSVTVRHLLTHSAGLHQWKPLYYHANTRASSYAYICQLPLAYPVGRARHYSDLGFMLLGYLIEEVSGKSLYDFMRGELFEPLGLQATSFNPQKDSISFAVTSHGNPFEKRMVSDDNFGYLCTEDPTSFSGWRNYVLVGEVNDGNAFYANRGVAGHAGLFSTASELHILLDLLNNFGIYAHQRFLSDDVVKTFLTKDSFGHGLGWAMSSDVIPAKKLPEGSFGHTGFTGTYVVSIPKFDLNIILLTNRQNIGVDDSGKYNSLTPLRRRITELMIEN